MATAWFSKKSKKHDAFLKAGFEHSVHTVGGERKHRYVKPGASLTDVWAVTKPAWHKKHVLGEEAPTNAAGGGTIAGIGVGPNGEPPAKKKRSKQTKRGVLSFKSFVEGVEELTEYIHPNYETVATRSGDVGVKPKDGGVFGHVESKGGMHKAVFHPTMKSQTFKSNHAAHQWLVNTDIADWKERSQRNHHFVNKFGPAHVKENVNDFEDSTYRKGKTFIPPSDGKGHHWVRHQGRDYHYTWKTGKNVKTGEHSFEYSDNDTAHRIWVTKSGKVQPE